MPKQCLGLWFLAALAVPPASAQEDLITDRPDQTESSTIVPRGRSQIEIGALASTDDGVDVLEVPGTLVRYGLTPHVELRVAWPGHIHEERGPSGVGDPELGAKLALAARAQIALLAHLSVPAGGEDVGSPRADPSLRLAASHTLSERAGLGWNLGWEASTARDQEGAAHTRTRFIYTTTVGFELGDTWGAFVEVFGDVPAGDPSPAAHSFDGGLTFLVTPRLQLDLAAGIGLDEDAPDRFVGLGLSVRLPR